MHVDLDPSAIILLGASDYPKAPTLNDGGSSFGLAMNKIVKEFLPLVSVEKYTLNLFDSADSSSDQYEKIETFLIDISKETSIKNLFLIYIGHGGIGEIDQSYFLTIRNTRDNHQQESSLQARTLANLLRAKGRNLRKYLFLDSCFSASAASVFMGTEQKVVKEKLTEINWNGQNMVSTGTAILCAAGKHKAAKYLNNGTMFSEALLLAIEHGDSNREKYLTFEDLYEIVKFTIFENNPTSFVTPEMHVPDQKLGMIHKINILPNFGNQSIKNQYFPYEDDFATAENSILIDRFRILKLLFSDVTGALYSAEDLESGKEVNIKVINTKKFSREYSIDRIMELTEKIRKFDHLNIVKLINAYQMDTKYLMIFEKIEGVSLKDKIIEKTNIGEQFSIEFIRNFTSQIGSALIYASEFLMHGSLCPENIFIDDYGNFKINGFEDYHLKLLIDNRSEKSITKLSPYSAPELSYLNLKGEKHFAKQEQYSIAAMLFELFGNSPEEIRKNKKLNKNIPYKISKAIHKSLSLDRRKRFESLSELIMEVNSKEEQYDKNDKENKSVFTIKAILVNTIVIGVVLVLIGYYYEWINKKFYLRINNPNNSATIFSIKNEDGIDFLRKYINGEAFPRGKYTIEGKIFISDREIKKNIEIVDKNITVDLSQLPPLSKIKPQFELIVETDPEYSVVKIMNIKEKYSKGIYLVEGEYKLNISAIGYITETMTINLDRSVNLKVKLEKISANY